MVDKESKLVQEFGVNSYKKGIIHMTLETVELLMDQNVDGRTVEKVMELHRKLIKVIDKHPRETLFG